MASSWAGAAWLVKIEIYGRFHRKGRGRRRIAFCECQIEHNQWAATFPSMILGLLSTGRLNLKGLVALVIESIHFVL